MSTGTIDFDDFALKFIDKADILLDWAENHKELRDYGQADILYTMAIDFFKRFLCFIQNEEDYREMRKAIKGLSDKQGEILKKIPNPIPGFVLRKSEMHLIPEMDANPKTSSFVSTLRKWLNIKESSTK